MRITSKTFVSGHFNEKIFFKDLVKKNIFTFRFLSSKANGNIINCVTGVNLILV